MVQIIENEEWRTLDINPVYQVSNFGRVRTIDHPVWNEHNKCFSNKRGIMCSLSNKNTKKYWRVGIQINGKQKHFAVHRLVAQTFIPNPNNLPQVNHIDGDKNNNNVSNLEWCTNQENVIHAWKTGLKTSKIHSDKCNFRKLTEEQVLYIKSEYKKIDISIRGNKQKFYREMAIKFNLKSENTIGWIVRGGTNKFYNENIVQTTN